MDNENSHQKKNIISDEMLLDGCKNEFTYEELNNKEDFFENSEKEDLQKNRKTEKNQMEIELKCEQANTSPSSGKTKSEKNENDSSKNGLNILKDNNIEENDKNVLYSKAENKIQVINYEEIREVRNNTNNVPERPKHYGRIPKKCKNYGYKSNHDELYTDNIYKRIIKQCEISLDRSVKAMFKEIGARPSPDSININIKKNIPSYIEYGNNTIINIYCKSYPNRLNKIRKMEKNKGKDNMKNKAAIKRAINIEKIIEKKEKKIYNLKCLFYYVTFSQILKAFLDDNTSIKIGNNITIELKDFITYSKCTNLNYLSRKNDRKIEAKNGLKNNLNLNNK